MALMKIHMYPLTWKGLTVMFLCFFLICSNLSLAKSSTYLQLVCQLGRDHVDVGTTFGSGYGIDERDMSQFSIREGESDFPSWVDSFIDYDWLRHCAFGICSRSVEVHFDILSSASPS